MGEGEGRQAGEMAQLVKHHARKPKVVPLPSTDLGWGTAVATLGWGVLVHLGVGSDVGTLGWGSAGARVMLV